MEHFDIYLVASSSDLVKADAAGFLDSYVEPFCETCRESVGECADDFCPFIIIDDKVNDDLWLACEACYSPLNL